MNKKAPFLTDAQRGGLVIAVPGVFAESFPTHAVQIPEHRAVFEPHKSRRYTDQYCAVA
jgi:hypothetical protein